MIRRRLELEAGQPARCASSGSSHEEDEPAAIRAMDARMMEIYRKSAAKHDRTYHELANGPEGIGPHEPAPFDLRKL